jgi:hypothetical protein
VTTYQALMRICIPAAISKPGTMLTWIQLLVYINFINGYMHKNLSFFTDDILTAIGLSVKKQRQKY